MKRGNVQIAIARIGLGVLLKLMAMRHLLFGKHRSGLTYVRNGGIDVTTS